MNNKFKKILIVTIVFLTLIFQFGIDGEKFNLNLIKAETLIEKIIGWTMAIHHLMVRSQLKGKL
jgi:hypothetical protein